MNPHEHLLRAELLAWAALGPTDPDGEVTIDLGDHVAYVAPGVAAALAQVHATLAQIGTPLSWQGLTVRRLDGSGRPL